MRRLTSFCLISLLFLSSAFAGIDLIDAGDDHLNCGSGASLDNMFAAGGTIYVRFHINYPEDPDTAFRDILSLDSSGAVQNWMLVAQWASGPQDRLVFDHVWSTSTSGRARWLVANGTSDNIFGCLILTYDSSSTTNDPNFYVNGSLLTESESTAPSGAPTETDTSALEIGSRVANNSNYGDNIYEVAGWSTALGTADRALLCPSSTTGGVRLKPNQIQPASLKFYYTLDDVPDGTSAHGDTFLDKSGNGNTCTGDDGTDDLGMGVEAEPFLSYP